MVGRLSVGLWLGLVLVSLALGAFGVARAAQTPLRQERWDVVVLAEPRITVPPDCPSFPFLVRLGPCIEVAADEVGPAVNIGSEQAPRAVVGYAATHPDDVIYGDLDRDGIEEAVIRIESGGTAGTIGFLLYRAVDSRPELVHVRAGYKLFPRIQDGLLYVTEPFYFGFEGNCCPTGAYQTAHRLAGDALELLEVPGASAQWFITGEAGRPASFAEVIVTGFYRALAAGRFAEAYAFLSPAFQAGYPFAEWRAGFTTTRSIAVETMPGAEGNESGEASGKYIYEVFVTITATDELPSGELVTRRFAGAWYLIKGQPPRLPLLLDAARIAALP